MMTNTAIPQYIENTLNTRMAEITPRDEAIDNLALIIDLKREKKELEDQIKNFKSKLAETLEILN